MAFEWLAQGIQPVQMPDPMRMAAAGMSLAQLSRQNRMGEEDEKFKKLERESDMLATQALARARTSGNPQQVMEELANHGEAGSLAARKLAKFVDEQQKNEVEIENKRSTTKKNYADADQIDLNRKVKAMEDIGSIAEQEARNPNNLSLSRVQSAAKFYNINLPPPGDGEDVPGYLSQLRAMAFTVKDRLANEATLRGQDMTSATAREGQGVTMRGQDMTQQTAYRGQNMTDSRAREGLALQRDKADQDRWQNDVQGGVQINMRTGETRPITAGGQPVGRQPDPAARKELSGINAEIAAIDDAITKAKKSPGAFGIMRGAASEAGPISESLAGRGASSEENQARAAVYNAVSSVIKERAGTAQSKQEQANILRFMPGPYDDVKEIEDKFNGYKDYLNARGSAYGGKPAATPASGGGWGKAQKVGG